MSDTSPEREAAFKKVWSIAATGSAKSLLYLLAMIPAINLMDPNLGPAMLSGMGISSFIALLDRISRGKDFSNEEIRATLEDLAYKIDDDRLVAQVDLRNIEIMLAHLNVHLDRDRAEQLAQDVQISQKLQKIIDLLQTPAVATISEKERLARLDQLSKRSREWCIVRWQAAGLSIDQATDFADNPAIGAPDPGKIVIQEGHVALLLAEVGAGKTLMLHRILQQAIVKAQNDSAAPIPVWIENEASGKLEVIILKNGIGLGNPSEQGATVIFDQADNLSAARATELLVEARYLAQIWPNTTVIFASRPISSFVQEQEVVYVPDLTEDEATRLVDEIAGTETRFRLYSDLPASILDATKRPLFAILLGIYYRDNSVIPNSVGQLLGYLVEQAFRKATVDSSQVSEFLEQLAIESTDRCSEFIPRSEVIESSKVDLLLRSGLIAIRSESIGFPLPILSQWFAAQSLVKGKPSVQDLATSSRPIK